MALAQDTLTEEQKSFILGQAITIQEQQISLKLADSLLWNFNDVVSAKQGEIKELHTQLKITNDKVENCHKDHKTDIKVLQSENKELKKENKISKFFNYLLGAIGLPAVGKLGIDYFLKR